MTTSVHCTEVRFDEFSAVENSETKRDYLLGYFHRQSDISMVEKIRDEPKESSYIEELYRLVSGGGDTE